MCYRKQRVNGPYFTMLKFFYQRDVLSDESWKVSHCYTIIFVVTYKKMCFILVKITIDVDILGTFVDP